MPATTLFYVVAAPPVNVVVDWFLCCCVVVIPFYTRTPLRFPICGRYPVWYCVVIAALLLIYNAALLQPPLPHPALCPLRCCYSPIRLTFNRALLALLLRSALYYALFITLRLVYAPLYCDVVVLVAVARWLRLPTFRHCGGSFVTRSLPTVYSGLVTLITFPLYTLPLLRLILPPFVPHCCCWCPCCCCCWHSPVPEFQTFHATALRSTRWRVIFPRCVVLRCTILYDTLLVIVVVISPPAVVIVVLVDYHYSWCDRWTLLTLLLLLLPRRVCTRIYVAAARFVWHFPLQCVCCCCWTFTLHHYACSHTVLVLVLLLNPYLIVVLFSVVVVILCVIVDCYVVVVIGLTLLLILLLFPICYSC